MDDDISQGLEEWSKHQHTAESQRAKSVVLLKDQLERYEFELALRKMKQKADERNKKKQRRIEVCTYCSSVEVANPFSILVN